MVASGRRLVVFVEENGGNPAWLHGLYDHAWETRWEASAPADLDCTTGRGARGNRPFILNHFIIDPLPSDALAEKVNPLPVLERRAKRCMADLGIFPNFITVDFVDVGDARRVVADLNGGVGR